MRVWSDEACLAHRGPPGYPERPERLSSILERLRSEGLEVARPGGPADDARAAVEALHDPRYVARFQRAVERGDGLLDSADNPLSAGTWEAAWGAVRATLAATDAIAGGEVRRAFAAVRPPGHHAERATAMGFCFFDNVAVAAQRLISRHGCGRVAILDFDVHHGNGTQHLFEDRADVLFVSLHQHPFYPGTGAAHERGRGAGLGATLNVPLAAGTGDAGYADAFRELALPALRCFSPEVLLVSTGFDAWRGDPLGGMQVSEDGFASWGSWLYEVAEACCGGRLLSVLEGGYDLAALPGLVLAYLRAVDGGAPI